MEGALAQLDGRSGESGTADLRALGGHEGAKRKPLDGGRGLLLL